MLLGSVLVFVILVVTVVLVFSNDGGGSGGCGGGRCEITGGVVGVVLSVSQFKFECSLDGR